MDKNRPLTFDLRNEAARERFEKMLPPSGAPFTATYTLQFAEVEKAGRMRSERLEKYRTALNHQLAIVERLIAEAGGVHNIFAMPHHHAAPHIFERALAEAERIIGNAIREPLADAGIKAIEAQQARATVPRMPPVVGEIIGSLARETSDAKELWPSFVGSLDREGLDPKEATTPAGDLQVMYEIDSNGSQRKMTLRTFRERLRVARKRTGAR